MRTSLLLFYFLYLYTQTTQAQDTKRLLFLPMVEQARLELGKYYALPAVKDSVQIEKLKFYIGHITLWKGEKKIKTLPTAYRLLDGENPKSFDITFDCKKDFDEVRFCLGVDSLTNSAGALSGDLDPTNGMYWTWQSGYINFKLEGKTKKKAFKYHIGGYAHPFNTFQQIRLRIKNQDTIKVQIHLDKFFEQIDIQQVTEIMSPNAKAVMLAGKLKTLFTIQNSN